MPEFRKNKPARNADELISKLKARKLIIEAEKEIEVKNAIRAYGYFRLSGYFGPLQSSKDVFRDGATFEDILRLYEFDRKLRMLTSRALKCIEVHLKAKLTDTMSLIHESDWYTKEDLFSTDKTKSTIVSVYSCEDGKVIESREKRDIPLYHSLLKDILESIDRNKEVEYIKKFKNDYGDASTVPSWMMMECISFGKLSRLFFLLKITSEKRSIASHFGANTLDIFTSWLHGFVVLRNACAHHTRIWNKKLMKDLMFPKKSSALFITMSHTEENWRKFYGISGCILKVLSQISETEFYGYKQQFNKLINTHGIDKQAMGFPKEPAEYDIWN